MLTTRLPSHCVRNYSVYTDPVIYSARFKRPSYNYWQLLCCPEPSMVEICEVIELQLRTRFVCVLAHFRADAVYGKIKVCSASVSIGCRVK